MSDYNERHKERYNPILLIIIILHTVRFSTDNLYCKYKIIKEYDRKLQTDRQVVVRDIQTTQTKIDHKDRQTYKMDVDK